MFVNCLMLQVTNLVAKTFVIPIESIFFNGMTLETFLVIDSQTFDVWQQDKTLSKFVGLSLSLSITIHNIKDANFL